MSQIQYTWPRPQFCFLRYLLSTACKGFKSPDILTNQIEHSRITLNSKIEVKFHQNFRIWNSVLPRELSYTCALHVVIPFFPIRKYSREINTNPYRKEPKPEIIYSKPTWSKCNLKTTKTWHYDNQRLENATSSLNEINVFFLNGKHINPDYPLGNKIVTYTCSWAQFTCIENPSWRLKSLINPNDTRLTQKIDVIWVVVDTIHSEQ